MKRQQGKANYLFQAIIPNGNRECSIIKEYQYELKKIGLRLPEILLPHKGIDLTKWSVIACDQHASEKDYWEKVKAFVGDSPSTLHLIFPEFYLEDQDAGKRIARVHSFMRQYLAKNILRPQPPGLILVDRQTRYTESRKGLLFAVDLEKYSYRKEPGSLIQATEETILDRLPPRMKIRENAALEVPHVMLLINDPDRRVIEPVARHLDDLPELYNFKLMMGGGRLRGFRVDDRPLLSGIVKELTKLAGTGQTGNLLMAVGDGNHSLANAKAVWEKTKKHLPDRNNRQNHPARFALAEVINLYDENLRFEPIHRVLLNIECRQLISAVKSYYDCSIEYFENKTAMEQYLAKRKSEKNIQSIGFVQEGRYGTVTIKNPAVHPAVANFQPFLENFLTRRPQAKIEYIHEEEVVSALGTQAGNTGFYLPLPDKKNLFKTIASHGSLPKKSFSIGRAEEKRFYMECRKIL